MPLRPFSQQEQRPMNREPIHINTLRQSNAQARELRGLVTVFVGGTGNIGKNTAKEVFLRTLNPRAYIIGRNRERGSQVCSLLHRLNPRGQAFFLSKDISLLRSVDELCADLTRRESKINCLFLTAGFMNLRGRNETVEGIDEKMAVNYYARMRLIQNMMPLLTTAADRHELSRVITVLAAGSEGNVHVHDLDLKYNFTLHTCLAHCVVMTDFFIEVLAKRYPATSFSHSYPGTVKSGIANDLRGQARLALKVVFAVVAPWILNLQGAGERHFFQMTSLCYPPKAGGVGIPVPAGLSTMQGMDFQPGSGAYLLNWDGQTCGDESVLRKYREMDLQTKVWEHTMEMFERAERTVKNLAERSAQDELEAAGRAIPDPIGWRPAV